MSLGLPRVGRQDPFSPLFSSGLHLALALPFLQQLRTHAQLGPGLAEPGLQGSGDAQGSGPAIPSGRGRNLSSWEASLCLCRAVVQTPEHWESAAGLMPSPQLPSSKRPAAHHPLLTQDSFFHEHLAWARFPVLPLIWETPLLLPGSPASGYWAHLALGPTGSRELVGTNCDSFLN